MVDRELYVTSGVIGLKLLCWRKVDILNNGSVVCPSVCPSVWPSVTLGHPAVGRNEMPFGRDTRVVPSNFVLGPRYPHGKERFGVSELPVRSDAIYYFDPCYFRDNFGK